MLDSIPFKVMCSLFEIDRLSHYLWWITQCWAGVEAVLCSDRTFFDTFRLGLHTSYSLHSNAVDWSVAFVDNR